ncbi:MAG: PD-(D/E)XK nuclease family protein [candidate division SR1 bacterium]|nr:PD-(D/E)XK nuclease family protein [candidate division SR1 bacterium]
MANNYNHTLTWSTTRITVLEYCNKKYYFNYYPHSLRSLNEEVWLTALLLKNLKSTDMRVGEKTHHLLSDYLRALKKGPQDAEAIQAHKDRVINEMRTEFEISKTRDYTAYDRDRKFGLSEHYYGENIDDKLEEAIQKVVHNLDVFLESDRNQKVQHYFTTAKTVYVENPREKDFEGMKLNLYTIPELRAVNVMAAPDFGVVISDNKYLIIDRKTGQEKMDSDGVSEQLKIYALKMLLKSNIKIENVEIEAYEVYLPSLHQIGGKIEKADIDHIVEKLKEDVEYQKQFLEDGDIIKNQPLAPSHFARTNSAKKCASCTFRKVCEDLKAFE